MIIIFFHVESNKIKGKLKKIKKIVKHTFVPAKNRVNVLNDPICVGRLPFNDVSPVTKRRKKKKTKKNNEGCMRRGKSTSCEKI